MHICFFFARGVMLHACIRFYRDITKIRFFRSSSMFRCGPFDSNYFFLVNEYVYSKVML